MLSVRKKYYQRGYQNYLTQVQRQYGLRNRNVPITSSQKNQNPQVDAHNKDMPISNKRKDKGPVVPKNRKGNEYSTCYHSPQLPRLKIGMKKGNHKPTFSKIVRPT